MYGVNRACHPGGHYQDYYPGTLLCSQVCNLFEDLVPVDEIYGYSIFTWVAGTSLKKGHQDSSSRDGHQSDMN